MALSKETEKWLESLEKDGKLAKEVVASLRAAAESGPDADNFIKGSVLRQDDYSRNIADVKAAQKAVEDSQRALQEKEASVTKYQAELGTWKAGADVNFNKALAERETAEKKTAAAIAKLKTIASASGLSEEDVLKDLDVTPIETKPPAGGPDLSNYLTKADINKATSEAALLDAMIYDLGEQHRELFGSRLPNAKGLVEEAMKAGKGIEQVWKEKYKVDDKIKENQEKSVQARIDAAVLERETSLRSSLSLPAPRLGRENDPYTTHKLFSNPALQKNAEEMGANASGVSAAIAAFNNGKYSQKYGQ